MQGLGVHNTVHHTEHYTVHYTVHWTLHYTVKASVHNTEHHTELYTVQCKCTHTEHHTEHYTVQYTQHCTVYTTHNITLQCTFCTIHYTVQRTLNTTLCTALYTKLHTTQLHYYTVQCTHLDYTIQYTVHNLNYTLHCNKNLLFILFLLKFEILNIFYVSRKLDLKEIIRWKWNKLSLVIKMLDFWSAKLNLLIRSSIYLSIH